MVFLPGSPSVFRLKKPRKNREKHARNGLKTRRAYAILYDTALEMQLKP